MKFSCNIDGNDYSFNENADKPLNKILQEILESFPVNNSCRGANCGNCLVMINGVCSLSCLIPACKLPSTSILTYEGFRKTRGYHDIERAFQEVETQPCEQCLASKTLLIESILRKMEKEKTIMPAKNKQHTSLISREYISKEISVSKCKCIDIAQLEKIINLAYQFRSRRNGRHS